MCDRRYDGAIPSNAENTSLFVSLGSTLDRSKIVIKSKLPRMRIRSYNRPELNALLPRKMFPEG